jgi:predicted metal-dependent peptidase
VRPDSRAGRRVTLARGQLVLNEPFFGTLLLQLRLVEDPHCETMWVDGVHLGYNPDFVMSLTDDELKGLLVHEVGHVALKHPWRRDGRDPDDWNEACDYAVNHVVKTARYVLPQGALYEPAWGMLPAEAIYEKVRKSRPPQSGQACEQQSEQQQKQDDAGPQPGNDGSPTSADGEPDKGEADGGDGGNAGDAGDGGAAGGDSAGQGDGGTGGSDKPGLGAPQAKRRHVGEVRDAPADADPRKLEQDWDVAIVQAEMMAKGQGLMPAGADILVQRVKEPAVDWREVLRTFVQTSVYSPDYSWRVPNRRYLAGDLYLPSLQGEAIPRLVIAVDTSGSIGEAELAAFRAEVQAVVEEVRPEKTFVVFCDAMVHRVCELTPEDEFEFDPAGGGGTSFRPVFDWVAQQDQAPACLVYLTDTYGTFPDEAPDYPVLWVSPQGEGNQPPFGDWVRMGPVQ